MSKLYAVFFLLFAKIGIAQADFTQVNAKIQIDTLSQSVSGDVIFLFEVNNPVDSIAIDARKMTFTNVELDNKPLSFINTDQQIIVKQRFTKGVYKLSFTYKAIPKKAIYFIGWQSDQTASLSSQIWTQGQGKYTSNWFPSFDDVNEKLVFNLEILFDSKYEVVSNGALHKKQIIGNQTLWSYGMIKPMSSYLLALVIGTYKHTSSISVSGTPLLNYYLPIDENKLVSTYKNSDDIFNFFEKEIGVPYPWQNYKQIPVRDFMYAGMENTTTTIFSDDYVVDSIAFNDFNYININAHELAHQWFGNLVTAKSSTHHWLQEGFATYYALLAERAVFGEDYFQWQLFTYAIELEQASKTDTIPLLNEKASTLTFYKKGAWALHILRETIGASKFKKAVANYVKNNSFKTVETADFLNEVVRVSPDFDTDKFEQKWLRASELQADDMYGLLFQNKFIKQYATLQSVRTSPLNTKINLFKKVLKSDAFYTLKQEVIYQLQPEKNTEKQDLLQLAIDLKDPKVDVAIASSIGLISDDFRVYFEKLINSNSYQAQEIAIFKLWKQFPEHSVRYLNETKGRVGFNDKNLELQWLFMSIATKGYEDDYAKNVAQLQEYTSPLYASPIRKQALLYCMELQFINDPVLYSLLQGTTHHNWQFVKFCKEKLRDMLKNKSVREAFEAMSSQLSPYEQKELLKLLPID